MAGQLWVRGCRQEHHWVCVVDDAGAVVLSRKLVNDEQPIKRWWLRLTDWPSGCPDGGLTTVYARCR
jgi:hypothetical protein